jgi:predicted RNA-binding Zn-ribbon protein involved in translation (DUF1610 family)
MAQLKRNQTQTNVNVTLGASGPVGEELAGKTFPCPLCGEALPILASKRKKPYFTCNSCGVQVFVRGKPGIARLREMAVAGALVSGTKESASYGIRLYNRLEQLKLQKRDLGKKRGMLVYDQDVSNAISLVDGEIEKVQGELAELARESD